LLGSSFLAALDTSLDRGRLFARCALGSARPAAAAFAPGVASLGTSFATLLPRLLAILFERGIAQPRFGGRFHGGGRHRHQSERRSERGERGLVEELVALHVLLPSIPPSPLVADYLSVCNRSSVTPD
jgi:hypothetical protein